MTNVRALVEQLKPLVDACYDEMHGDVCATNDDNDFVASRLDETGKVVPAGRITFGMIRRAKAALASVASATEALSRDRAGEQKVVAFSYQQLMHDSQGGWEDKLGRTDPRKSKWIKPCDLQNVTPLYASPAPDDVRRMALEEAAKLWVLLDDVDTLDDACRADDALFRRSVRAIQQKRFAILSGEQIDALRASSEKEQKP